MAHELGGSALCPGSRSARSHFFDEVTTSGVGGHLRAAFCARRQARPAPAPSASSAAAAADLPSHCVSVSVCFLFSSLCQLHRITAAATITIAFSVSTHTVCALCLRERARGFKEVYPASTHKALGPLCC